MCGEDHCQTCTPDAFMIAWTQGRHHTTPRFDDDNQRRVARIKRMATLTRLRSEIPAAAMKFPEFLQLHSAAVCQFAKIAAGMQPFDILAAGIPTFASYVAGRPRLVTSAYETGRGARKRRKRAKRQWRQARITHFLLEVGGVTAMRQMMCILGREVPAWLTAPEAPVEMARAA
jgi:hypothetical protein